MDEPDITINGQRLTVGQAMTVICAIETFASVIGDDDQDEQTKALTNAYIARINEIRSMIFQVAISAEGGR